MDARQIEAILAARAAASDAGRPEAVARVHATGHLTARERITALLDPGSEVEQGGDALAGGEVAGGVDTGHGLRPAGVAGGGARRQDGLNLPGVHAAPVIRTMLACRGCGRCGASAHSRRSLA